MGNDKLSVTVDSVRVLLMNYETHKCRIQQRILELYKELEDTDSFIQVISFKKNILTGMPRAKGGLPKGLTEIVEQHDKLMNDRISEISAGIEMLMKEEESLRRVWVCYQALSYEEYEIITRLYVKKEPYKQVEAELEYSHGKFEKLRKEGLEDIISLYDSDMGYEKLCALSYTKIHERKGIKKECETIYQQYSLDLEK